MDKWINQIKLQGSENVNNIECLGYRAMFSGYDDFISAQNSCENDNEKRVLSLNGMWDFFLEHKVNKSVQELFESDYNFQKINRQRQGQYRLDTALAFNYSFRYSLSRWNAL